MKLIYIFIPIVIFLLTACGPSQADLDAANARAAVAEQRAYDAQSKADAVSFQAAINRVVDSPALIIALIVLLCITLLYLIYMDAPSRREHELYSRRERLREFELENERAQILLEAKRLQLQQRQQTQARQLPSADRRVMVRK